jgi:hypothetical protein
MTAPQRQALQKAWDILTEHFDHVLVVADWESDDEHGERCNAHEGWWYGGSIPAIGLAEFAKDRILKSGTKYNEPEKPEDEAEI